MRLRIYASPVPGGLELLDDVSGRTVFVQPYTFDTPQTMRARGVRRLLAAQMGEIVGAVVGGERVTIEMEGSE